MIPSLITSVNRATAILEFELDGLGICRFDNTYKYWEIIFLRPENHELKIEVRDAQPQVRTYPIGPTVRRIDLQLANGSNAHYDTFPKGYFQTSAYHFSRAGREPNNACGYPLDFRWAIDFIDGAV